MRGCDGEGEGGSGGGGGRADGEFSEVVDVHGDGIYWCAGVWGELWSAGAWEGGAEYIRVLEAALVGNGVGADLPWVRAVGAQLPVRALQDSTTPS